MISPKQHSLISHLPRGDLLSILRENDILFDHSEGTEALRNRVELNVADGSLVLGGPEWLETPSREERRADRIRYGYTLEGDR